MVIWNIQMTKREVDLTRQSIESRLCISDLPPGERGELINLLDYIENEVKS